MPEDQDLHRTNSGWGPGQVALGYLGAWTLFALFQPLVYALTGQESSTKFEELPLNTVLLSQVPFSVGLGGSAVLVCWRRGGAVVADLRARFAVVDLPVGMAIGVVAQFAVFLLYAPVLWFTDYSTEDIDRPARELSGRAHSGGIVLLFLVVAVLTPICEELFFRGFLLRGLERRVGTARAIALSSVLFGAAHLEFIQFPALALFGLLAAVLTVRTDRLGAAVAAHMAFNATALIQLLWM